MVGHIEQALHHWNSCESVRELSGGNRNRVVLVSCRGELFVAKSTIRSEEAVRWVVDVQKIAETAGFIVPHFIPAIDGRFVVDGVTLERWIEGKPVTNEDRIEIRDLLSAFHESCLGWNQRPGFASSIELLDDSSGGDVNLDVMPEGIKKVCRKAWQALETQKQSVIHGDLNIDNILKTRDGHFALIDWDESRVDISLFDIVGLFDVNPGYPDSIWHCAKQALNAWEVAVSWVREPVYAMSRAKTIFTEGADV